MDTYTALALAVAATILIGGLVLRWYLQCRQYARIWDDVWVVVEEEDQRPALSDAEYYRLQQEQLAAYSKALRAGQETTRPRYKPAPTMAHDEEDRP